MARYKHIDTSPRLIAVDLQQQLLPGTFEHALNHLPDYKAQAHGTGSEQELLVPVVKAIQSTHTDTPLLNDSSLITADAGS